MNYDEFFRQAYRKESELDFAPFDYQRRLAEEPWPDLLDVPTGLGKTAAVVLAWLWKRRIQRDPNTPRRLVYCLPMRVLVEQTVTNIRQWLESHDLHGKPGEGKVSVNLLMGGEEDIRKPEWASYPEEDAILVGTQDMLLSRALMRGYGMRRYQWPIHFAFLHNDTLWVYDEVQLMGPAIATSAQLEAFRRVFKVAKPARSLWVSATLHKDWLSTVDMRPYADALSVMALSEKDRSDARDRLNAGKRLSRANVALEAGNSKQGASSYVKTLAEEVRQKHRADGQTLVIVNRVERAQALYKALRKSMPDVPALLLHARFRPAERRLIEASLGNPAASHGRVVVATQAIEAGVDISSSVLFSELAPWSSMVQRFGRCNRYGEVAGGADVFWIDIDDGSDDFLPYSREELAESRKILSGGLSSANVADLPKVDGERELGQILRRRDFLDLFNTERDLSGFDVDISPYIRDRGPPHVQVFWRIIKNEPTSDESGPARDELCPASMGQVSGYLGKKDRKAWTWDALGERWVRVERRNIRPGAVLLLNAADGGYSAELGFEPSETAAVEVVRAEDGSEAESHASDALSYIGRFVGLTEHLQDVAGEAEKLAASLETEATEALVTAARWHDVGKAHPAFQNMLLEDAQDAETRREKLWAKSATPSRRAVYRASDGPDEKPRRYFRHELASMLAWLEHGEASPQKDLIAYLIAAHHGKIRLGLSPLPTETQPRDGRRYAHGVWEGDRVPSVRLNGISVPETELKLDVMELGLGPQGPSWTERTQRLLAELGPFQLAWLEALVRIADWRASKAEREKTGEMS